jgi:hypothetical protein
MLVFSVFQRKNYYPCLDANLFYKDLSGEEVPVSVFLPAQTVLNPSLLKTEYYHSAVIVDIACEDNIQLLSEVRQRHMHLYSLQH